MAYRWIGPPSQSLGVDPVDPTIMRRPPRRKDAPIINQRLLYRVLFSASIIVVETLFIYIYALSDDKMSRREQTMVNSSLSVLSSFAERADFYLARRLHVSSSSISFLQFRIAVLVVGSPTIGCSSRRFQSRLLYS